MPLKNSFAASTTKGVEKLREELGSKKKRQQDMCHIYKERFIKAKHKK